MNSVESALGQAQELIQAGRYADAEQICADVLAANPEAHFARQLMAASAHWTGRAELALEHIGRAIALAPENPWYHDNLAVMLQAAKRFAAAEVAAREACRLAPGFAEAHCNLGIALKEQGRLAEAEQAYARAIGIRPDFAEAINNLGTAIQAQGRIEEAEQLYRRVLALQPRLAEAYERLAETLESQGRLEEAESACRSSLTIAPGRPESLGILGKGLHAQGRIAEAVEAYGAALANRGASALVNSNALFCMQYRTDVTPADLEAAHCEWDVRHGQKLKSTWKPCANDPDPNLPLRVGFVSSDFGFHPVGLANDEARLAQYRRELRNRIATSPLYDGERFSRQLADGLVSGWERLRRVDEENSRLPAEGRSL